MTPLLSLIIPVGPSDDEALTRLLTSIEAQEFPHERLQLLIIREGNSEEAKAFGIRQATGDIIGMLCTDNQLLGSSFLREMVETASGPSVIGAYPGRYAYVEEDTALSRYFALLGANDPLCWWLGKADRQGYGTTDYLASSTPMVFHTQLPSIGDNGFFLKRQAAQLVVSNPATFGSCMDMCEDLRRLGYATYTITPNTIWHRTGESWSIYFRKRYRYVQTLYWQQLNLRRWRMVHGPQDWLKVLAFAVSSLLLLPHLWVALRGYRRIRDPAWFLHPLVCSLLTFLYTWALFQQLPSLFRHWIGHRS